jgi:hypothetical protein
MSIPNRPMYDVTMSLLFFALGIAFVLFGRGRFPVNPNDPVRSSRWLEKYGRLTARAGWVLLVVGAIRLSLELI